MGAGIDYSMGMSNVDRKTGIHYGVISQNEVLQAWADDSEPQYPDLECPICGCSVLIENNCPKCNYDLVGEFDDIEPSAYVVDDGEYQATCGDDGDIFIVKSPYYTKCKFCSPCAPGAGYLMSPNDDGIKAYCFNHDWFESGIAPYPVYCVATDKLIEPKKEETSNGRSY
jgi:hypothetical protein